MKITELHVRNFLTISEASLSLSDKGLVLLQGENLDDPSAKSNGAGKSSIPDALCWALYGTTARGIAGDAVVNRVAKKNCSVFVVIEDAGVTYKIERFRKDATHKNQVFAWRIDDPTAPGIDLSKGTDRETQEVINTIIGSSEDVFRSSVYAGQESMPDLPGMTDKFLKLLIEEAAGVERLSKAYDLARQMVNRERSDHDALTREIAVTGDMRDRAQESLSKAEIDFKGYEDARKGRSDEYRGLAKVWADKAKELNAEIASMHEAGLRESLALIEKKLEARDAQNKELERLQGIVRVGDRAFAAQMAQVEALKRTMFAAEKDLGNIADKVGQPCGECGKPYHEDDIHGAKAIAEEKLAEAREALKKAATDAKGLKAALDAATSAAERFRESMEDFSELVKLHREARDAIAKVTGRKSDYESMKANVERYVNESKAVMVETNPFGPLMAAKEGEVSELEAKLKTLADKVGAVEERMEDLENAAKVFGPAGVRARILDTVTPFLNDRTAEYLGSLSDGNITAVWSTLSRTKAGDLKEKFAIDVTNDKGAESFAGMSGGEKRKVRLATTLALQDLVASRATKPISLFVGDEIDDALDTAGLERLMTILERKARERGTVLVVSHSDLRDWIDSVAVVTKEGGASTVSGALC